MKVGASIDGRTVIEEGLTPGQQVITGGQFKVQPGSVVTIAPLSPCASGSVAQFSDSGDWGPPLMGAAFIAAIGFAVYGITQANKNSTPSPASP